MPQNYFEDGQEESSWWMSWGNWRMNWEAMQEWITLTTIQKV